MAFGTVAQRLIESHLVEGSAVPGDEIGVRIDHTLTQDATGTMVMLELEAMGLDRVRTDCSVQYVDHNLLQADFRNADDHRFLQSASRRFGLWFSKPGNGVSHPVHQQRFGLPGATMIGSDSHTPAAGAIGMLAIGAGGLEVALAMAGEPFRFRMPEIWGVRLEGELAPWCSAKDVVLEMLRRHDVDGGVGRIVEFHGPGLAGLSAWDRHVIANMGTELGATTTVFPSDAEVRRFLASEGREADWSELSAEDDAVYDVEETLELSAIEPLIARPSSPGDVVPVREVAGTRVSQVIIGSSANPGPRDFAVPAMMVRGRQTVPEVSFEINPTSREILELLAEQGHLRSLVAGGARIQQAGCMGCIGMGQAPGTGEVSLRTMPRNFPGRSGTRDDRVYLCSPETATAAALTGEITDPRDLGSEAPEWNEPDTMPVNTDMLVAPAADGSGVELVRGPNIVPLPEFDPMPDEIAGPVLLKVGDDVSTDEILPAGTRVLPFRSNIPAISRFTFDQIDTGYPDRADEVEAHVVVGRDNYGQGSSREHAAIAPRYLGLRAVVATSFARIHWQNLANFGILALTFADPADYDRIDQGDEVALPGVRAALERGDARLELVNRTKDQRYALDHGLSPRQVEMVLAGSLMNVHRAERAAG